MQQADSSSYSCMPYNGTMEHVILCFDDVLKEQRNRDRVSTYRLIPTHPQQLGLCHEKPGTKKFTLPLEPPPLLPRVAMCRKLDLKVDPGLGLRHSSVR